MNSIENLLNQAITPSNQQYTSDTISRLVELINKDPSGTSIALRLIAHKIQSPQEREALNALKLLEVLATHCGASFQAELGKFKFLNELIKVLSPKHLGDQTTEAVKHGCARLLYQWHRDYSEREPKFSEAYNMLCEQRLINPESLALNGSNLQHVDVPAVRRQNIFDRSKESARLAKLLRSKNPADIVEANRIIQCIVEEDRHRMEKVSQRLTEMESLKNNAHLLRELINTYERGEGSEAEKELMEELAQNIRRARPALYNFSLTHEENDLETMAEIAKICDEASTVLDVYLSKVINSTGSREAPNPPDNSRQMNLALNQDLLSCDLLALGLEKEPLGDPNFSSPPNISQPLESHQDVPRSTASTYGQLEEIFANFAPNSSLEYSVQPVSLPLPTATTTTTNATYSASPFISRSLFSTTIDKTPDTASAKTNASKMFDDLDSLGRRMLGLDTLSSSGPSAVPSLDLPACIPVDEPLRLSPHVAPSDQAPVSTHSPSSPSVDLSQLDVALSTIQPHSLMQKPYVIYPTNPNSDADIKLVLHYASNKPAPNVRVFVATLSNQSSFPVTDLYVRFGVKKPRLLRQLTPSGNSLAAYSSFLPNGVVNQVVLIFDPLNEATMNLRFQLSFTMDNEDNLESGDVKLPIPI